VGKAAQITLIHIDFLREKQRKLPSDFHGQIWLWTA
jgi:hypothetical protein